MLKAIASEGTVSQITSSAFLTKYGIPSSSAALRNIKALTEKELVDAINEAMQYDSKIIVEEMQNVEYDLKMRKMKMEHEENSKAMDLKMQNMKNTHEKELKEMENKDSLIAFIVIMGGLLVMLIVVEAICFIGMMLG